MRRNLATILEMEGCTVVQAPDGRAGVTAAKEHRPSLILCDVMMPEMSGYEVLEALRADTVTVEIPFIFLTARGERGDIRTGMNLGADDYLTKPVTREDLLMAVGARLRRHAALTHPLAADGGGFHPDFSSPAPLRELGGLTEREAEVLLWVAQGKSNGEIGMILGAAEKTIKKHMTSILSKLGCEQRSAAMLRALEVLSQTTPPRPASES